MTPIILRHLSLQCEDGIGGPLSSEKVTRQLPEKLTQKRHSYLNGNCVRQREDISPKITIFKQYFANLLETY